MNLSPLTQRVITGVVLLAVFLWALFYFPPFVWALAMMLVLVLAADELGKLLGSDGFARYGASASPHYRWLLPLGLTVVAISFFFFIGRRSEAEQMGLLVACYALHLLLVLIVLPWWIARFEKDRLHDSGSACACFAMIGGWLLFCSWLAMLQLRSVSPWLLLAVLV
ncbi:MAG: phosphatidate cytidylyltransferase, partial [Burkholderiales bacterium]|nr:phosphatidate cytidylyltransferase [Burkholderiales bacterium]